MAYVMTNTEFVNKAKDIANNYKTLYIMGCFGAPMGYGNNRTRYMNNNDYNRQPARQKMIKNASDDTFGFDCVCLLKGILWGWKGDVNKVYGGAQYASNGVPDINEQSMIAKCTEVSSDFTKIVPGEMLWLNGHAGIYIGDGLAVESTPAWKNKVQITAVANIGAKTGYNSRKWTKHGKLPWIEYKAQPTPTAKITIETPPTLKVGSKGGTVKVWQQIMVNNGISVGSYGIDGDYGSATKTATVAFQKKVGLSTTGEVDSKTWIAGLNTL